MSEVHVIVTIVLYLEEENLRNKLVEIQDKIKTITEIQEFGFNIYDRYDPKLDSSNFEQ